MISKTFQKTRTQRLLRKNQIKEPQRSGTNQAVLGSSDQLKVPASLSLFLKSEKIPALLYLGKGLEYKPFSEGPSPILKT